MGIVAVIDEYIIIYSVYTCHDWCEGNGQITKNRFSSYDWDTATHNVKITKGVPEQIPD